MNQDFLSSELFVMSTKSTKGKQNKTTKEKSAIKKKRSSLQREQEKKWGVFLGRPEKFKSPEELRTLFNCYLASCQELVKVPKEIPVQTEEVDWEPLANRKKPWIKMKNSLITEYTISGQRKRTKVPTKLGFYLFLGGMSHSTWKSYEIREEFSATVEAINNFFERVLESWGLEGTMNPQMVQFVLNTSYGRNPKNVIEETSDFVLDENELSDD